MTIQTETPPTADDVLVQLQAELAELAILRTQTQREVEAAGSRMKLLAQRISAIQAATTMLASLAPRAPEQEWLAHLTAWRKTLCDELLGLPPRIRDPHTLGVKRNLELSLFTIDRGLAVLGDTGYDLMNLRLGELMRADGYEPVGADADRYYSGVMPWFGSLPQVERRIADLQQQRADAQARLADALLDDAERERLAAESKARRDALNAASHRKIRGDGSQYDRYPDGRIVEVTT